MDEKGLMVLERADLDDPSASDLQIDPKQQEISRLTDEIHHYKKAMVGNVFEIGRRLLAVKELLPHGEWLYWLEYSVEFSERTAREIVQITQRFTNWRACANLPEAQRFSNAKPVSYLPLEMLPPSMQYLPYKKLVTLCRVPEEDCSSFLSSPHEVNGMEKTVEEMSCRELEMVVRERYPSRRKPSKPQKRTVPGMEHQDPVENFRGWMMYAIEQLEDELKELPLDECNEAVRECVHECECMVNAIELLRKYDNPREEGEMLVLEDCADGEWEICADGQPV